MVSPKKKIIRFFNKSLSEKLTFVFYFIFFVIMALIFLYPIYSAFLISFSTNLDLIEFDPKSFWDFFRLAGKPQYDSWKNVIRENNYIL